MRATPDERQAAHASFEHTRIILKDPRRRRRLWPDEVAHRWNLALLLAADTAIRAAASQKPLNKPTKRLQDYTEDRDLHCLTGACSRTKSIVDSLWDAMDKELVVHSAHGYFDMCSVAELKQVCWGNQGFSG